mmetsp:Transcript_37093/g.69175  ORF Transcript_37093/g.69175 Transcript_37093/m.69175 type:complete len:219 (-) Transcript_37093:43-699(-)
MRLPILGVCLASDELHVMWALRIAVSSAIPGSRRVVPEPLSSILGHLHKVHGSVHAALDLGGIHVQGKLTVLELEHHVVLLILHEEEPRAHIGSCDESKTNTSGNRGHTIGALILCVIHSFNGTGLRTSFRIRANGGVPNISGVAVGIALSSVDPPPVCIQYQLLVLGSTTPSFGTLLHGDGRAAFHLQVPCLLAQTKLKEQQQSTRCQLHGKIWESK